MFRKPSTLQIGIFMVLFMILVACLVGIVFIIQIQDDDDTPYPNPEPYTNPQVETYIVETRTEIVRIDQILTLVAKTSTMEDATAQINHIWTVIAGTQTAEATLRPPQN